MMDTLIIIAQLKIHIGTVHILHYALDIVFELDNVGGLKCNNLPLICYPSMFLWYLLLYCLIPRVL